MKDHLAMLAAFAVMCCAAHADEIAVTVVTDQPTAHGQYIPRTGDIMVCGDFDFVLMSVPDWELWTNRIARLESVASRRWANEHKTEAGRMAWHGAVVKTEVVDGGRAKMTTYADGYQWTEKATPTRSRPVNAAKNTATNAPAIPARQAVPARLAEKRRMQEGAKVREVNATFGPGGKVIKSMEVQ